MPTTSRHYLMCRPTYFAVEYEINPWMDMTVPVDTERACAQWDDLVATFRRLGHTVDELTPVPGLPDMVFAANGATVIDGRVLGAQFARPERLAEESHHLRWHRAQRWTEVREPVHINEAEGDYAVVGDVVLAGHGFRTDPRAHIELQEYVGMPVVSLQLVDPRFYHLDVALCALDEAAVAYYPAAFSAGSQRVLRRMYPDAVLADAADAEAFGLNAVSDGTHVVLPAEAEKLAAQLAERGYEPVLVHLDELRKGGGSVKCCTQELRPGPTTV